MRTLYVFILGASLSCNAMLFYTWQSATPMPGSKVASFLNAPKGVDPGALDNEVIETMKTARIINTLLMGVIIASGSVAVSAQEVADPLERMYRSVEASNVKNNAEAGSLSLATLSGTRSTSLSLAEQNAISNQQAMDAISRKMVAQTTIVGATEGSKAVETVQQAGDPAQMATLMTMFNAILQAQKVNAQ